MALLLLKILLGLLPVLCLLFALVFLDSYKLVAMKAVLVTILSGCAAAGVAFLASTWVLQTFELEMTTYSWYVAPMLEELLKGAYLIYLLRSNRIGFMVDGAIRGFAIGAGFALVENMFYMMLRPEESLFLWVIRGFGTAMMHGATTAIVGITAKSLSHRRKSEGVLTILPGLVGAILIHMIYNHFFLSPSLSTFVILVALPTLLIVVFRQSEKSTMDWLGIGFDTDREVLEMITIGQLSETRIGQYLHTLQDKFPGTVVADMLCLLRLRTELSIKAKGVLMMKEAGFDMPPDPEVAEKFAECRYLEHSIGKTGKLALLPFLHSSSRDAWQIEMLKGVSA
jgi:RsiW-degrading membrane proteinase PrsW (M82 family)